MTYTKIKLYIILIEKKFRMINNKKKYEKGATGGPAPISLLSEYSSSN